VVVGDAELVGLGCWLAYRECTIVLICRMMEIYSMNIRIADGKDENH
jgi:hypothetical protein